MYATDLVGINGITQVLLVYTCQQGVYPRGHILPLLLPPGSISQAEAAVTDMIFWFCPNCWYSKWHSMSLSIKPGAEIHSKH
jgi:hypothetical protein